MIYRIAGIVGINPEPFTLRELDWMLKGKRPQADDQKSEPVLTITDPRDLAAIMGGTIEVVK